jgi:hypothetical protein
MLIGKNKYHSKESFHVQGSLFKCLNLINRVGDNSGVESFIAHYMYNGGGGSVGGIIR